MVRALAVTTLALALALAAPAGARSHVRRHTDPVAYMRAFAPHWWGAQACKGSYAFSTAQLSGDFGGQADWFNPAPGLGEDWPGGDPTAYTQCRIDIPPQPDQPVRDNWPDFCQTFLHEFGHLLGRVHSTDPTNIMEPGPFSNASMPTACLKSPWDDKFSAADWGSGGHS